MRVIPIASTIIRPEGWELFRELGFDPYNEPNETPFQVSTRDCDILGEFSGRNCYRSFLKPNPATASNKGYLANILDIGHESVLEHSTIAFYVDGVSRNLLLELERHRHISFSVISTRYVPAGKMGTVIHPGTPDDEDLRELMRRHDENGRKLADTIYLRCKAQYKMGVKESREVARQVLPGNLETMIVVSGNLRAWRYIVNLRWHTKADKEIQLFAEEVLRQCKKIAPNSFQDFPNPEDNDS